MSNRIPRNLLKFRKMISGQGMYAQLPNGGYVYDYDPSKFIIAPLRYHRTDVSGETVARGETLESVVPELADNTLVVQLQRAGVSWAKARSSERDAASVMYAAISAAVNGGVSQVQAAKIAGVDRMTVRRALGKL